MSQIYLLFHKLKHFFEKNCNFAVKLKNPWNHVVHTMLIFRWILYHQTAETYMPTSPLTAEERKQIEELKSQLLTALSPYFLEGDTDKIARLLDNPQLSDQMERNVFGLNPLLFGLQTAKIAIDETGLKRDGLIAILLYSCRSAISLSEEEIGATYGEGVKHILHGLDRVQQLYQRTPVIESENFRNLLVSFAEDMRVILIIIADRVNLMRQIRDTDKEEEKRRVSEEASYL